MKLRRKWVIVVDCAAVALLAAVAWFAAGPSPRTNPLPSESPSHTIELNGMPANSAGTYDMRDVPEPEIEIEMGTFFFSPTVVIMERGVGQILIELGNETGEEHSFTSKALGVDRVVAPLKVARFLVRIPDEPGTYLFFCRFHADQGMRGAIRVV